MSENACTWQIQWMIRPELLSAEDNHPG